MVKNNSSVNDQRVLIIGTGALASLFAARLAASGKELIMLGSWQAAIDNINRDGLTLVDQNGGQSFHKVKATSDIVDCEGIPNALVLVKTWQTKQAAQQLQSILPENGLALSLQNGLGNAEILAAALGHQRVALGSTTTGATLQGPGIVRPGGEGCISIADHPRIDFLSQALKDAGFDLQEVSDLSALLWEKLAINAAINPLTAFFEIPNGALLEDENLLAWMEGLALEVAQVALAGGINFSMTDPFGAAKAVAKKTASNRSSMFQDILRGAPTEIDAICGAVVSAGNTAAIDTPANQHMLALIQAKIAGQMLELGNLSQLTIH